MKRVAFIVVVLLHLAALPLLDAEDDTVMKAMHDELSRSMRNLQLNTLTKPYFISYRVRKMATTEASATFGSVTKSGKHQAHSLTVVVRVGDYTLDNANFLSVPRGESGVVRLFRGSVRLPLEDDYKEIRRQIWLATDAAYKQALEDLSKKRAALQTRKRSEDIPDFSREETTTITDEMPPVSISLVETENLVRELSALFMKMPEIFTSIVDLEVQNIETLYLNSEGTSFRRFEPGVVFRAIAKTQAPDGMPLEDFVAAYGRSMRDFPTKHDLAARIREMGIRLEKLRQAALIDRYNGPVLLEGQAAAELFSQVFAPKLLALRSPLADSPKLEMYFLQEQDSFADKLGAHVLPEFLSVVDNPLLDEVKHIRLVGGYKVDEEGVRARETRVVQKGILKTLLASRSPIRDVMHSTGNSRGSSGPTPSNLVVTAENGLSEEEMNSELLKLAKQQGKDYGIVVTRISNPLLLPSLNQTVPMLLPRGMQAARGRTAILGYKIFPDGRREAIRNAELSSITAASFRDVVAASEDRIVYSTAFLDPSALPNSFSSVGGSEGGTHILSFVVPSLLFEDVTLKNQTGEIPKLPILKHPFFGQ